MRPNDETNTEEIPNGVTEKQEVINNAEVKVYTREEFQKLILPGIYGEPEYNTHFKNIHYLHDANAAGNVLFGDSQITQAEREPEFICLESDNQIIGVCYLFPNSYHNNRMDLRFLSMDSNYQNAGGGKKLLRKVFEYCQANGLELEHSTFTGDGDLYLKKSALLLALEFKEKFGMRNIFSTSDGKLDYTKNVFTEEFSTGDRVYTVTYGTGAQYGELLEFTEKPLENS